jgi:hypothetical protein
MPTVFIIFGFVFKFYSNEHGPMLVHVFRDGHETKYEVASDFIQVFNHGFKKHELSIIECVLEENKALIVEKWNEGFPQIKEGQLDDTHRTESMD